MTEIAQQSKRWHEWRAKGIGGSDVAAVLGVCDWTTPYQLWLEKTSRAAGFEGNYATERGQRLEPAARAFFETVMDIEMTPDLVVHPQYRFMRVSLDGQNRDRNAILEIKCPLSIANHEVAVRGEVPEKYRPQVQYQLLVSGAELAYFLSYHPDYPEAGKRGAIIEVRPDRAYQEMLTEKVSSFWVDHVIEKVPPPFVEKDFKKVRTKVATKLFGDWKATHQRIAEIEREIQEKFSAHPRIECAGVWMINQDGGFELRPKP